MHAYLFDLLTLNRLTLSQNIFGYAFFYFSKQYRNTSLLMHFTINNLLDGIPTTMSLTTNKRKTVDGN